MILLGAAISASLPLSETVINAFHVYILPGYNYFLPFLVVFPSFIGYSIVKHNLFDFDAIIKRTYGYILTTAGISGIYVLILAFFNYVFGSYELTESPIFTLLFILAVVFLFNPVRNRVQKFIDRVFYRLEYDYRETVERISETLRALLNLEEIERRIMEYSRELMFVETGSVLLLNPQEQYYEVLRNPSSGLTIAADDPLIQRISKGKKEVSIYDVQEDPLYSRVREACRSCLKRLGASLIVPMIYEDRLVGLISLGNKKSGKFYRREDIKLLKILANQGAVAIENARMAEQMKSEEKVRANLARYLSPQIVERVIQKDVQVNLGGDKKIVTVLFSDIRGFTRISETLPPDQLVQLLNEYFTEMAAIIFANQGTLDKFIGDAIVAVFGSLISIHNPGRTAVQAAIQMMKTLETANQRWTAQYGFAIHIGIGINTGEVFLGNIGSPERMEFTVIGDTVNIASRLSGAARAGQILITQETSTHLGTDIQRQALPPMEVKGKTEKQAVFEIMYS
jgi:adenylate cyclase